MGGWVDGWMRAFCVVVGWSEHKYVYCGRGTRRHKKGSRPSPTKPTNSINRSQTKQCPTHFFLRSRAENISSGVTCLRVCVGIIETADGVGGWTDVV